MSLFTKTVFIVVASTIYLKAADLNSCTPLCRTSASIVTVPLTLGKKAALFMIRSVLCFNEPKQVSTTIAQDGAAHTLYVRGGSFVVVRRHPNNT